MGKCSFERTATRGSERTEPACFGNCDCPLALPHILSITIRTKRSGPLFLFLIFISILPCLDSMLYSIYGCYFFSSFRPVVVGLRCLMYVLIYFSISLGSICWFISAMSILSWRFDASLAITRYGPRIFGSRICFGVPVL